jgi:hypothetical protein
MKNRKISKIYKKNDVPLIFLYLRKIIIRFKKKPMRREIEKKKPKIA